MNASAKVALVGLGGAVVGALLWSAHSRRAVRHPPNLDPAAERAFFAAVAAIHKGEPFPNELAWREAIDAISRGAPITIIEALNTEAPISPSPSAVSAGNQRGQYG